MRLAKPIYEGLPWIYLIAGLALLAASYRLRAGPLCGTLALLGLLGLIGGTAVWLRRRDYRARSAEYLQRPSGAAGASADSDDPDASSGPR